MSRVSGVAHRLRNATAPLSPARRRWIRFLHDLPLDPDTLPRPVTPPGPRDFIVCGSPRTGTSLLCAALFQPPHVVTVMEPWDGMRLAPAELFASLRAEIDATGELRRGRLDVPALQTSGAARWCRDGEIPVPVETAEDYHLGVKWPAYWRYLDLLPDTKFLVCLRDPDEVLVSYEKTGGRVGMGLDYDTAFNRAMNEALQATPDPAARRVALFDHIHERILPHLDRPNVLAVRYERWFSDPDGLLADVGAFLGTDVSHARIRIRSHPSAPASPAAARRTARSDCRTAAAIGYEPDAVQGPLPSGGRS